MTTYTSREKIDSLIKSKVIDCNIAIDIGCGIRPQSIVKPVIHICVDPHKEYLNYINQKFDNKQNTIIITINSEWDKALELLTANDIDTVFLLDVIEHLKKAEGKKLLKKTAELVNKQVVIFTPLGFIEQEHGKKDAWGMSGGKWQNHLSGWQPSDFGSGWETFVVKNYHMTDNMGKKYDKPKGALWAIYTKPDLTRFSSKKIILNLHRYLVNKHVVNAMLIIYRIYFKLKKIVNSVL